LSILETKESLETVCLETLTFNLTDLATSTITIAIRLPSM